MKSTDIIYIIMVISVPFLFIGCYKLLSNHIYHKMDCQQFNIDHIEVRTGIDIPKTTFANCEMDEHQSYRKATFTIDSTRVDIADWLVKNKFQQDETTFINSGSKADHSWLAEFDPADDELVVQLDYLE